MKFHRNLVEAVVEVLKEVFFENKISTKAVEKILKSNKKWGSKDRAFIAECSYDCIRNWILLWHLLNESPSNSNLSITKLIGIYLKSKGYQLPDWEEFSLIKNHLLDNNDIKKLPNEIKYSIPKELYEYGISALGEKWDIEISTMHAQADVILRVNELKVSKKDLINILSDEGIIVEEIEGYSSALKVKNKKNLFSLSAFKEGLFEIQDANSQLVAEFASVKPGDRVIDACAGAGGKSLHLAALMKNKGKIISLDIDERKLHELKRRANRNGIDIIETKLINSKKIVKRLYESADIVLIDAPCTGSGVFKRNPDAKYRINKNFILELVNKQSEILKEYSLMAKKGGKLIYATCSILPEENEIQIKKFINHSTEFELIEEKHLYPSETEFDGFYIAKLIRK